MPTDPPQEILSDPYAPRQRVSTVSAEAEDARIEREARSQLFRMRITAVVVLLLMVIVLAGVYRLMFTDMPSDSPQTEWTFRILTTTLGALIGYAAPRP